MDAVAYRRCRPFAVFSALLLVIFTLISIHPGYVSSHDDASHDDDHHAKVLILGAGASGLEAAKRLHENGMDDFMIIEGADYIGGRVRNVPFGGLNVELGANWAYPGSIVDQVKDVGLEYHHSDWESLIMRNVSGHDVSVKAYPSWDRLYEAIEVSSEIAADILANNKPDMSQRAALRLGGWMPKTPLDQAVEWFTYDFEWAELPDISSLKSTAKYEVDETLMITDQRGFIYLFHNVIEFLQEDPLMNHIHLNQTVVSIDQSSDDVIVVTCEDGTQFNGDYVIVTFSLGVMQSGLVEFIPPLPDWKVEELFQLNMGSYTRILLKFPYKFWDDEEWIMHVNERRGYYPAFLNFEANGLFPNGTNILVAFAVGEESRRIERQPDAETKAEVLHVLRDLYGDAAVPNVEEMTVSGWNRNPLVRGAYSNFPVEVSQECFRKIEARHDRVFFAGEHTEADYNAFVIGAQFSGRREANKILECMTKGVCPDPVNPGDSNVASNRVPQIVYLVLLTMLSIFGAF